MSEELKGGDSGDSGDVSTDMGDTDYTDMGPSDESDGIETAGEEQEITTEGQETPEDQEETEQDSTSQENQNEQEGQDASFPANDRGELYPEIIDPRTDEPVPFPEEELEIMPQDQRAPWGASERRAFIEEWERRGYSAPPGGWGEYEIHHIHPREYGGNNDFENMVPIPTSQHRGSLNPWWAGYSSRGTKGDK